MIRAAKAHDQNFTGRDVGKRHVDERRRIGIAPKAEKSGAKVLVAFQPIPGNGAIGVFVDPTGAAFGVWEKEPKKKPVAKVKKAKKK